MTDSAPPEDAIPRSGSETRRQSMGEALGTAQTLPRAYRRRWRRPDRRVAAGVRTGDAYGEMMLAALESDGEGIEIVERDSGLIMASRFGPEYYFAPYRKWPSRQRRALRLARGRVLDVGAGAGRVPLHLQEKGHDAVAIDASPGTTEVCRRRGVRDARVMRIEDVDESLGIFDTVIMFGNNLGLLASRTKAPRILQATRPHHDRPCANSRRVFRPVLD